jgi:hypothetical protein
MSTEDTAIRMGEALCDVMNVAAVLHSEAALQAHSPVARDCLTILQPHS